MILKLDQKDRSTRPDISPVVMRTNPRLESGAVADSFYYPCDKCCAVQLTHFLWDGDVLIREWRIIDDHVLAGIRRGLLERICRPREQEGIEFRGKECQ